tara:strand:- start:8 stop:478 length:471 start_codon:yes stop_codon:yes gene_type:complete
MPLHSRGVEVVMASSEERVRELIAIIDGQLSLIANTPGFPDSLTPVQLDNYNEAVEKRNKLAKMIDAPFVDKILAVGDKFNEVVDDPLGEIGSLSLRFVEGFGAAFVKGLDGAYDAVRDKLRGKEPDVIAGFTVAAISILTVVYLYQSAKAAKDAF